MFVHRKEIKSTRNFLLTIIASIGPFLLNPLMLAAAKKQPDMNKSFS